MVNLGHIIRPKKKDRSGFPADRGHSQKGVLGTVVTIATPSIGLLKKPRYGMMEGKQLHGVVLVAILRIDTTLSNGTSISIFPIQKRRFPSDVTSS